jgi:hypothetical protein
LLHCGQAGEHVTEVAFRVESTAAGAFNDGVEDGAGFAGGGIAEKQVVLFLMRSSA